MRRVGVILLCFLVLAAAGCSRQAVPQATEQTDGGEASVQPQPQIPPEASSTASEPSGGEKERFEVTPSEDVPGWQRLEAKAYLHRLEGGDSSEPIGDSEPMGDSRTLGFSLDFPGDWSLEYSVFYNSKGEKVAEFMPPVLLEPDQEEPFLASGSLTDLDQELVSVDALQVGAYKGTRAVIKAANEVRYWYPYIYCLSDGTYGARFMFYSAAPSEKDQELFDRIVNTFAFGE